MVPLVRLVFFGVICTLGATSAAVMAKDSVPTYTFGIVPQQSASTLVKSWLPILKALEKETGFKLMFKTAPNIPEYEQRILRKEYDISYMNPYHYTIFSEKAGYKAFAMQGNKKIKGVLVARKDKLPMNLADLNNQEVAFPAPAAFAATVIPKAEMQKIGVTPLDKYTSSHESVYKTVAMGGAIAGGGIERTFANLEPAIRDQLAVFWTSKGYTPHAFAAIETVPWADVLKLQKAMLNLSNTPEGRKLLEAIKFKSIVAAQDSDWQDVRDLDIRLLDKMKQVSGSPNAN
ncbi:phosphate/phosphite/phosphonate ABC transporter substrate-binding protein [Thiosulfativibrio zosterae]|uniref:Phosphate ABC transporter substrate-binding protein n=1 Tax=Thiosulfativibrio zosterae TaxID=2675053 RepID=A0A6F8PL73_9GAMM|nr:phosphate/phosphite/phosphonate ABC transporter substrate-binding protein [Thiosulfativibrio zosterae]BBP42852.1 phosphate ABC transporter substrate-binding protein [Thiosulfativibrio zosterae]